MSDFTKTCNTCHIEKTLDSYWKNKRNKDEKENKCIDCSKFLNSQNREKANQYQKNWRAKNPNYNKEYQQKEIRKEYYLKYYQEHSEEYIKRKQQWRKDNPEKATQERQNYNKKNKDKLNEYHRKWKIKESENNPQYKIKTNLSRRIRYELNTLLKGRKTKRTTEFLGCSIDDLKIYLESKFTGDMNWDNYGTIWHIDHIIPCNAWDLTKDFDNICCWNFRNLQPLSQFENQSKKDKYNENDKISYIEFIKSELKII